MMFSNNEYSEMEAELKAEVARLREELTSARAQFETVARTVRALEKAHAIERAAHEATKAELAVAIEQMQAAEARVAELERELDAKHAKLVEVADKLRAERTALDQARGLLDEWLTTPAAAHTPARLLKRVNDWLRAHPTTATPARSCPRCGGIITQQTHVCPATPAATGAEHDCDVCASVKSVVDNWGPGTVHDTAADALDTIAGIFEYAAEAERAEKEQGT